MQSQNIRPDVQFYNTLLNIYAGVEISGNYEQYPNRKELLAKMHRDGITPDANTISIRMYDVPHQSLVYS